MSKLTIPEYLRLTERRILALKRNTPKAAHKVGAFTRDLAKAFAPKKTGQLASGIISRNLKKGATVYAFDPGHRVGGGNALALWANRQAVFEYTKKKQKVWQSGQAVVYGGPALLLSGHRAVWTGRYRGEKGYFGLAVEYGRKKFREDMIKSVRSSIGGVKV